MVNDTLRNDLKRLPKHHLDLQLNLFTYFCWRMPFYIVKSWQNKETSIIYKNIKKCHFISIVAKSTNFVILKIFCCISYKSYYFLKILNVQDNNWIIYYIFAVSLYNETQYSSQKSQHNIHFLIKKQDICDGRLGTFEIYITL